jgi:hypothetical protein
MRFPIMLEQTETGFAVQVPDAMRSPAGAAAAMIRAVR